MKIKLKNFNTLLFLRQLILVAFCEQSFGQVAVDSLFILGKYFLSLSTLTFTQNYLLLFLI